VEVLRAVTEPSRTRAAGRSSFRHGQPRRWHAEGQIEVLQHLEQTPETLGAPIHDRMEPVKLGEAQGCPVYADRAWWRPTTSCLSTASRSTRSSSARSSRGCSRWRSWAWVAWPGPRSCTSLRCGSATSSDSGDGPGSVPEASHPRRRRHPGRQDQHVAPSGGRAGAAVFEREPQLLAEARQHHASLPFDQLDVLLVDEIGKDVSERLRHQVIGRIMNIYEKECERRVLRASCCGSSARTGGNAIGLGLADYLHRRVTDKMDAG